MTPYIQDTDVTVYHGDSIEVLKTLPTASSHMCITSPPFFNLRNYGVDGQIGLEETPGLYIEKLVDVFAQVKRVLRNDGVLLVEIGDSYATRPGRGDNVPQTKWPTNSYPSGASHRSKAFEGIKPKDLIGIPWMLAFALRADGWYLRAEIIWDKPDAMPESVTDRPTRSHSQLFLLTKSYHYFWDADAIREPFKTLQTEGGRMRDPRPPQAETLDGGPGEAPRGPDGRRKTTIQTGDAGHENYAARDGKERWPNESGANARSVWSIVTESTPFAHFATMPTKLAARAIKAGTSEHGCCANCGAPWQRLKGERMLAGERRIQETARPAADERGVSTTGIARSNGRTWSEREMLGWSPTCDCGTTEVVPAVVLDPFAGSGTTCLVARRLGRRSIGIELSMEYLRDIAAPRLAQLSLLT